MEMTTLTGLVRVLERAAAEITPKAVAVVAKGALNVKNEARKNAQASAGTHAKLYPGTITYDPTDGGLAAEIGPEKRGQGNLGPILEYGNGGAKNPPHRDLGRALDVEEPRFLAEAAKIALPWV